MRISRLASAIAVFALLALPLAGQMQPNAPANPLTTDALKTWSRVEAVLLRAAEKMPEESYAFKPVPEVRSFGQIIGHVVDSQNGLCSRVSGKERPQRAVEKTKTAKADLVAALKEAGAFCDAAFEGLTDANASEMVTTYGRQQARLFALFGLTLHSLEHYGNLVTYMRLKGLVPPSSEPRK
jgi:uncharacterized damage-inducible protein DinB